MSKSIRTILDKGIPVLVIFLLFHSARAHRDADNKAKNDVLVLDEHRLIKGMREISNQLQTEIDARTHDRFTATDARRQREYLESKICAATQLSTRP